MAKKSFLEDINPAELFISSKPEKEEAPERRRSAAAPAGYKPNYEYIETKSKRLQLLVRPSLLDQLRATARANGQSMNDLVNTILEEALRGEKE